MITGPHSQKIIMLIFYFISLCISWPDEIGILEERETEKREKAENKN